MAPTPSSPNRPVVALSMTDEDVVARVAALMGQSYHQTKAARYRRNGWKTPYYVHIRGTPAVLLMRRLRPHMGKRRQAQIDRAIANVRPPREPLISEQAAKELARRYWAGERQPTKLGAEYGVSKNLAIHYIGKFAPRYPDEQAPA